MSQIPEFIELAQPSKKVHQTRCCAWCLRANTKLFKCSKCAKVHYCSRECQIAHWKKEHKTICGSKYEDLYSTFKYNIMSGGLGGQPWDQLKKKCVIAEVTDVQQYLSTGNYDCVSFVSRLEYARITRQTPAKNRHNAALFFEDPNPHPELELKSFPGLNSLFKQPLFCSYHTEDKYILSDLKFLHNPDSELAQTLQKCQEQESKLITEALRQKN
jgi:hypothetical protein